MCGIVGYVGNRNTVQILVEGLKRLEYRGYDSAGICYFIEGTMAVTKEVGKLIHLEKRLAEEKVDAASGAGIGHTRWATHGAPSVGNAHPHRDCSGRFSVVHNGIIENHTFLKKRLQEEGHHFLSETDTEVIVHLVEKYFQGDLAAAVRRASFDLEGSFAVEVMSALAPERNRRDATGKSPGDRGRAGRAVCRLRYPGARLLYAGGFLAGGGRAGGRSAGGGPGDRSPFRESGSERDPVRSLGMRSRSRRDGFRTTCSKKFTSSPTSSWRWRSGRVLLQGGRRSADSSGPTRSRRCVWSPAAPPGTRRWSGSG
ncbi:MAG: hypothetical protein MPW15_27740 [Candidatus Manganitrophus sp.]|nr:hypothetical protein [Candidatus Manganitrophus sp.]